MNEPSHATSDRARAGDPLLGPFLRARDDAEARLLLGELVAREAEPLAGAVVRRRLGASEDGEDVRGQVRLRLIQALAALRGDPRAAPILDFRGYVATTAAHACDDALRRKYPLRLRLRNQLRYLLTHDRAFALRRDGAGRWLCSLDGREAKDRAPAAAPGLWSSSPRDWLRGRLAEAEAPVELDELLAAAAAAAGIDGGPAEAALEDSLPTREAELDQRIDQRRALERLWCEIVALPLRQRAALLLNLRDTEIPDVVAVFPASGVASFRQIAEALEMAVDELAGIWNRLPLDDLEIGERLGLTRQQVINLRSSARARLGRRLRGPGRRNS